MKIQAIKVYKAAGYGTASGDEVQVSGVEGAAASNDVFPYRSGRVERKGVLGQLEELNFSVMSGSAWATGRNIRARHRIVVEYENSERWYRVDQVVHRTGGANDVRIRAFSILGDLSQTVFRRTRAPLSIPNYRLPLRNITLSEALTIILDDDNGSPSFFALGNVAAAVSDSIVNLDANYSSHLDLIRSVCEQAEAEIDLRLDSGTMYLDVYEEIGWSASEISGGQADPDLRLIEAPSPATNSNRKHVEADERSEDYFSRLVPLADGTGEDRVGIRDLWWQVTGAGVAAGGQTTFEILPDVNELLPIWDDSIFVGFSAYFEDDTFNEILATDVDGNVTISGERAISEGQWVKIVRVTSGAKTGTAGGGSELVEVDFVYDPDSEDTYGVVERVAVMEGVGPYANLIEQGIGGAGTVEAQGDLSDWLDDNSRPWAMIAFSTGAGSPPTVEKITDGAFVEYGTAAMKVTGQAGTRISTLTIPVNDIFPLRAYFSAWIAARMLSGKAKLRIEEVSGVEYYWPPEREEQIIMVPEETQDETRAYAVAGIAIKESQDRSEHFVGYRLVIDFLEDSVCIVDAVTATNTHGAWEYQKEMGPKALLRAALTALDEHGGRLRTGYSSDFFDISSYDPGAGQEEVTLGSWVHIKDLSDGAGGWLIDVEARVIEIHDIDDPTVGNLIKRIRIGERRKNVASRLVDRLPKPRNPNAPKQPGEIPENPGTGDETPGDPTGAGLNIICGQATIENGNTSVEVTPTLPSGVTVSGGTVLLTPITNWGSLTEWWRDNVDGTSFEIHVDQDPGEDVTFSWVLLYPCPFPAEVPEAITEAACEGGGDGTITISWPAHEDDPDGYVLRYGTEQGGPYANQVIIPDADLEEKEAGVYQYTVSGLTNGTTYYSIIIPYWRSDEAAPDAPVLDEPTEDEGVVTLTWSAVTGSTVHGYRIYRSTTQGSGYTEVGEVTKGTETFDDDSVSASTTYYYIVRTFDIYGQESEDSNEESIAVP